ncbi:MAG: tetratricopeptide repeat protein [Candidatus Odinarchaeota archaeon]
MSHPVVNQLARAEELFDTGKLDEAFEILNDWYQFEELNPEQRNYFQFLKGLILFFQNKYEPLIELGKQIHKEGQVLNDNLQILEGLFLIVMGLGLANKFDKAVKVIDEAELVIRKISHFPEKLLIARNVRINILKAWINIEIGNEELAQSCLRFILKAEKEIGTTFEIIWANLLMARLTFWQEKKRIILAIEYAEKALSKAKQIKFNHLWIALSHLLIGAFYYASGELDKSLKYRIETLKIFKKIKNGAFIAVTLNDIGAIYAEKGEYDLALEYFKKSLLFKEIPYIRVEGALSNIIEGALEKGDLELAQSYLNRLEEIYSRKKDSYTELLFKQSKARILKNSPRIRDKAKAQKLFKQIINTETSQKFAFTIDAYINLCDLLLTEIRISNADEIFDELNHIISELLILAEKFHSNRIFCETFILQAKLALANLELKPARRFLTQAQRIAENCGIKRLAMKISYEHDELLRKTKMWESLKESDMSLSERLELTGLNEQMENMVKRRMIEVPEISKEDPVMLLILTEGGNLLYSKKFINDFSFKDDILGGFLITVNYIISEVFSEGLDRAVFGQYTLLMMPLQPFLVCYIFKGHSYFAHHKINNFLDSIQKDNYIWQSLQNFFQKSKSVQINDIPSLESKIMEIFVEKKD